MIPFSLLVWGWPRLRNAVNHRYYNRAKGFGRTRFLGKKEWFPKMIPVHWLRWLAAYNAWLLIVGITYITIIGVLGTLLTSVGWELKLTWGAVIYNLFFARANGEPNGAHIISYLGVPLFALVVSYKCRPFQPIHWDKLTTQAFGDIFQGGIAALFLGSAHEAIWIVFYYIGYGQYVSWDIVTNIIRDISFCVMLVILILAFWKYPGRTIPMKIFVTPLILFTIYCGAWFFLPHLIDPSFYNWFPITTINNPNFGTGLYAETPWFPDLGTNVMEVGSWLLIYLSFIYQVLRLDRRTLV